MKIPYTEPTPKSVDSRAKGKPVKKGGSWRQRKGKLPSPLNYENKLTIRELKFVELMFRNPEWGAVKCVEEAGFPVAKARQFANLLMRKKLVQAALNNYTDVVREEVILDQARILEEECQIAFSDIRQIPGCPEGIPDSIAKAIASFEIKTTKIYTKDGSLDREVEVTKYTLWPKGQSLERLERHLGMFEKDNKQKPSSEPPSINLYIKQGDQVIQQAPLVGIAANGYHEEDISGV